MKEVWKQRNIHLLLTRILKNTAFLERHVYIHAHIYIRTCTYTHTVTFMSDWDNPELKTLVWLFICSLSLQGCEALLNLWVPTLYTVVFLLLGWHCINRGKPLYFPSNSGNFIVLLYLILFVTVQIPLSLLMKERISLYFM